MRAIPILVALFVSGAGIPRAPASAQEPPLTGTPAAADTLRGAADPSAASDTLRGFASLLGRADTAHVLRRPPRAPRWLASPVDLTMERKLGAASLEDALRLRRAAILGALPVYGPSDGSLRIPDGGSPIRLSGHVSAVERTTDETLIGSAALGFGMPTLASALDDPRGEEVEALDLDGLGLPPGRETFQGPGEALTRPVPAGPAFEHPGRDAPGGSGSRTSLYYRKGDGDELATGVRFLSTAWGRRVYGSFARLQANGSGPIGRGVSSRHAVQAELPRFFGRRVVLEGRLFDRSIRDSVGGESEWEGRRLALAGGREGDTWTDFARVQLSREKLTGIVSSDGNLTAEAGARERWQFPAITVETSISRRKEKAFAWIAGVRAASRRIVYRLDSIPAFDPRRGEARFHLGLRRPTGTHGEAGVDLAYDAREGQAGFVDARVSWWGATERLRARVDLESAHERPSWVDLLTPASTREYYPPDAIPSVTLTRVTRSGDPGLKPRRLDGVLGSLSVLPRRDLRLDFSGSVRRITDDFGWDLETTTSSDTLLVSSIARRRGNGWTSHASAGWEVRVGPFHTRGVGWVREGPDSIAPLGGSPPRRALDASVDARLAVFRGDLLLRFGIEAHARSARRSAIREPAQATWDGSVTGDFGAAAFFLRFDNMFDRTVGSAVWDPLRPSGAPLPGRTVHVGIIWNLVD
ncbi:MAG: hypothetical protein HY568_03625 [Candidatus Latescibacteria bacterium]|nr:hypothetical protein [Candidatus Latescibacterota bacterium]